MGDVNFFTYFPYYGEYVNISTENDPRLFMQKSVREKLAAPDLDLTPSERRVARELLLHYPAAGLGPAARLAQRVGVSDPTITRFVVKLGYGNFAELQAALLAEVEEKDQSPLTMFDDRRSALERGDPIATFVEAVTSAVKALERETLTSDLDRAASLLANPKRRIICVGGRFSGYLAGMLRSHLVQLHPDTHLAGNDLTELSDLAADASRRDVVVAFDYRRYQRSTIDFVRQAAEQGASVILFTDIWRSPLAASAEIVLTARVETASPFDTLVPALTQIELLVARLLQRLGERARPRLDRIDQFRRRNRVTLEADEIAAPAARQASPRKRRRKR